ncbi:MAG: phytoene desaturase family protein [Planctomycetota bacterium]
MTPSTNGQAANGQAANGQANAADKHVVIVGGGLAGLASAVELSSGGARVTLVEKNDHLGGKMNLLEEDGFSFDMGPTIITLPQVLRGIIERSGRKPEDYIDLIDLDPQWRCHWEDGTVVDVRRDPEVFAKEIDQQFPGLAAGSGYKEFIDWSRRMFRLSEKVFFYTDLGGIADLMRSPPTEPGLLGDVLAMRMHSTVGDTIHKYIKEPHIAQVCEHFLQYVGSSPFMAPAILGLIAAAQADNGCWYAMSPDGSDGGTRMVARSLAKIADEAGIERVTGHRVERIIHENGVAVGVKLDDGREIKGDAVVSNCDVQRTYRDLCLEAPGAQQAGERIASKYTPACSGLVLYLGLDRQYEHLAHHNFIFSKDSVEEFDDIYTKGIPARDPTIYLAVPSRTDPTQAPEGGEAFYALIHTPFNPAGQPDRWEKEGGLLGSYRKVVIDKLKKFGMEDIEDHIVVDRSLTPDSIDRMYNAEGGAIYGLASHGKLAGGFKPRNRSKVLEKLYLTGGSANPGPGVPMVLMSGVTAARCVLEDLGIGPAAGDLSARERARPELASV